MTAGHPWEGNWKARLYARVREHGHDSLAAFAEARPAVPLHELADELGEHDVAAVQLLSGLLAEAEQSGRVTRFVRDVFVRELADGFPDGWPDVVDEETRFDIAHVLARWTNYTPESHKDEVQRARGALRESPPPPGWRPLGPDDALLRTLLPDDEA
ncbi:NUDIX hydrolase [Corallococcus macrosporus]|uniref:NUDIX hydrolase n=1 Tax=Corallococcus macrosporus TaxID=35 RepID=UPI0009E29C5C|nr:NUDIX hydrolase [Corallococcus macrosporus]